MCLKQKSSHISNRCIVLQRDNSMKIKLKRCSVFFRRVIFGIVFICLLLAYCVHDFKTDMLVVNDAFWINRTKPTEYLDYIRVKLNNYSPEYETVSLTNDTNLSDVPLSRRIPGAIIIGVKKCGTRALLEYMRLHPEIKAAGPEPHFFDRNYHMGLEWYRQKMPKSSDGQLTMEKTPRYFVTEAVPERIYNVSKTIKLILVVRNPVTRAISDFTQSVSKGEYNSSVTFRSKAIRRDGRVNKRWSAINIGLYALHFKKWLEFFPLENIHIVNGENLIWNPISEINLVQDFLGLERMIPEEDIYMNSSRGFPCINMRNKDPPYKCFRRSKGRHHSFADKSTIAQLRRFYEPYNNDFYKMTKCKFKL